MTARVTSSARTLVLCATDMERGILEAPGRLATANVVVALCGFGPIVAAARTAALIAEYRPARVVLVGIAGSYDAALVAPGAALEFDDVAVDGVGVGEGEQFLSPAEIGFPQWADIVASRSAPIMDSLSLAVHASGASPRLLLTACAASASTAHAVSRRARFPTAIAEDMEGFAVAAACALADVPVRIIRGISNVVGDRVVANWSIAPAMHAARAQLVALLDTDSGWRTRA